MADYELIGAATLRGPRMNGSPDALSAVRRSSQVYHAQIAEQTALSCGVALTCAQYPGYHHGNQLREVVLPAGRSAAECFDEVQSFYAQRGLTCYRWVPAAVQPVEPLEAMLAARGFTTGRNLAMKWTHEVAIQANPRVKLFPARAMRKALREVILSNATHPPDVRAMLADVTTDRLDDPSYDVYVALFDGRPAGYAGLLQAGDIGRIENVFIAEAHRRQGVGRTLIAHLLALAKRLAMRITCLETEECNAAARSLYKQCGLEAGGTYVEFMAPRTDVDC
jgi:GNAT superfamily N-acetyltransferase